MAEIVARFADGRLLIQEEKLAENQYYSGRLTVRIGGVRVVEKILSLEAYISGFPQTGRLLAPIKEARISGDTILMVLRRQDIGVPVMTGVLSAIWAVGYLSGNLYGGDPYNLSGCITLTGPLGSGTAALSVLSSITSGLGQYFQASTSGLISGRLNIIANVVAIP